MIAFENRIRPLQSRLGRHAVLPLMAVCALVYAGLQWVGARTIGSDTIFAASRQQQRADIAEMARYISAYASAHCSASTRSTLLFDDMDVITPYLWSGGPRLAGCVFTRETPVTRFSAAKLNSCDVLLIHQVIPDRHGSETDTALAPYLQSGVRPWHAVAQWSSRDSRYSLTIFSHLCAPAAEGKS